MSTEAIGSAVIVDVPTKVVEAEHKGGHYSVVWLPHVEEQPAPASAARDDGTLLFTNRVSVAKEIFREMGAVDIEPTRYRCF